MRGMGVLAVIGHAGAGRSGVCSGRGLAQTRFAGGFECRHGLPGDDLGLLCDSAEPGGHDRDQVVVAPKFGWKLGLETGGRRGGTRLCFQPDEGSMAGRR